MQWPKEKVQKDKQRFTKHTNKMNIEHTKIFSSVREVDKMCELLS